MDQQFSSFKSDLQKLLDEKDKFDIKDYTHFLKGDVSGTYGNRIDGLRSNKPRFNFANSEFTLYPRIMGQMINKCLILTKEIF